MGILDGRRVSRGILSGLQHKIDLTDPPCLAIILSSNDEASEIYCHNKARVCSELGIKFNLHRLRPETKQKEFEDFVESISNNPKVTALLIQLPLSEHINKYRIMEMIPPRKDVDCFSSQNLAALYRGNYEVLPCTPAGIVYLLDAYDITIEGKHCVVIGRSEIVGKPLALVMLHRNATVTICHTKTQNLAKVCRTADILVSCVGIKGLITADMVKNGAVVVDVGISRVGSRIYGDVDFDGVSSKASFITPSPGGVGPMTIALLMKNILKLHNQNKTDDDADLNLN